MIPIRKALTSSLGKKFVMGLSGLALVVFLILHLAGNVLLYAQTGEPFNHYAEKLHSYGPLFYVAEIGLLALFLLHIALALRLAVANRAARPTRYRLWQSKDRGNTPSGLASRNMVITGLTLFAFLILHLKQFRFGPTEADGYVTMLDGKPVHDLHRVVVEAFHQPLFVAIYVAAMVVVGTHLRHGFWSAFQSLGAMRPRMSPALRALALFIAAALAVGFLLIPIWIYFER